LIHQRDESAIIGGIARQALGDDDLMI